MLVVDLQWLFQFAAFALLQELTLSCLFVSYFVLAVTVLSFVLVLDFSVLLPVDLLSLAVFVSPSLVVSVFSLLLALPFSFTAELDVLWSVL